MSPVTQAAILATRRELLTPNHSRVSGVQKGSRAMARPRSTRMPARARTPSGGKTRGTPGSPPKAALASIAQLLYFLAIFGGRD